MHSRTGRDYTRSMEKVGEAVGSSRWLGQSSQRRSRIWGPKKRIQPPRGYATFCVRLCVNCRRADGRGLDAGANRRGYPPRKPFASKENTSGHPVAVPVLYRRGRASLTAIMRNGDKDATRVAAAAILLDRGGAARHSPKLTRTATSG